MISGFSIVHSLWEIAFWPQLGFVIANASEDITVLLTIAAAHCGLVSSGIRTHLRALLTVGQFMVSQH